MKKRTVMMAGAMLILAACNKEKRNDITKENLAGTYTLVAKESQVGTDPVENDLLTMDPCDKDNLIKLNADMTYNVVDAGEQCNPDSNENGVWSLLGSSQIVINGELNEIKSFDGRRLIVEYKTSIANTPIRIKATLAKQ